MNDVIAQAPTSSERLASELNPQPFERRRLAIMGAVFQSAPLRWWFAMRSRPRSDSDLAKVPIYPGALGGTSPFPYHQGIGIAA